MKPVKTKQPKHLLAVSVSTEIVAAVDSLAARQFRSRSDVVRQSLLATLEREGLCIVPAPVAA